MQQRKDRYRLVTWLSVGSTALLMAACATPSKTVGPEVRSSGKYLVQDGDVLQQIRALEEQTLRKIRDEERKAIEKETALDIKERSRVLGEEKILRSDLGDNQKGNKGGNHGSK